MSGHQSFVSLREEETDSLIFSMNRATLIRGRMKRERGRKRERGKDRAKERERGGLGITFFPEVK